MMASTGHLELPVATIGHLSQPSVSLASNYPIMSLLMLSHPSFPSYHPVHHHQQQHQQQHRRHHHHHHHLEKRLAIEEMVVANDRLGNNGLHNQSNITNNNNYTTIVATQAAIVATNQQHHHEQQQHHQQQLAATLAATTTYNGNSLNQSVNAVATNMLFSPPDITEEAELRMLNFPAKSEDLSTAIPLTIIFALLLITGCIGNICTAIVIVRPKNRYMHTATNYYLFSLALSDFLFLVLGLPQEMYLIWQRYPYIFGETFCIVRGYISEVATLASILIISAFTVERYVAICHPLWAHTMSQLPRCIAIIVTIWIVAFFCAIPPAISLGIITQVSPNLSALSLSDFSYRECVWPHF